jgi:diamine N-acetyltransferase
MGAQVEVRLAVNQDAVGIINIARITWIDTYAGIILPENQERLLGKWYTPIANESTLLQGESWFYVAVIRGQIIGFAQFISRSNTWGELTRIYVLPEYQRQGIGHCFLKAGLASLIKEGVEEVFVEVEKDNAKGIDFNEREGFHPTRELSFELPGQSLKLIEFAKSSHRTITDAHRSPASHPKLLKDQRRAVLLREGKRGQALAKAQRENI